MKAIQFRRCGSPDVLEFVEDRDNPRAGPGEVLVRVRAAGLNPRDAKVRKSNAMRLSFGISLPAVPGNDIAGDVVETAPGVSQFAVGDAVMAMLELGRPAGYAEFASVPAQLLVKKPASLDFHQAAAIPLAGLTALQLLRRSNQLGPGKKILVNGASGGVGSFAVQIAKAHGAVVIGVSSGKNADFVHSLGADSVIDYARQDATVGGPYDLIVDTIGNISWWRARGALTQRGVYASCAPRAGLFAAMGVSYFSQQHALFVVVKPRAEELAQLSDLVASGKMRPVIDRVFELREAAQAHRYLETNRVRGKLVLAIAS